MAFNKKQVDAFFIRAKLDPEKGRATMDAMRARAGKITRQLKAMENSGFEPVDDIHLAIIVMAEEVLLRAFADIVENGVMVTVDAAGKVKQKNHSVSTFFQMSKLISDHSKKLGLSALDRKELNIETELDDGLPDD